MKTFINSLMLLMFMTSSAAWSQTTVSGTVTDQANTPLPGVNIIIKGTATGTTTGFDGDYNFSAKNGETIVFSYIGFKPQEIVYRGQQTLNVTLQEDTAQLDEIVLIGYGSTTKQDATGAVEKVGEKEFNQGAIVSPEQLLSGKSAGVRITSGGGDPGGGSEIRIRGGASLSANNSPLIVVDGLPLDQRGVQGVRNQLNAINPNDIEDFVVLKDASATAIYGSRASNGVILITTKKGKTNSPFKVEYDLKASVAQVTDYVDVLSADEFRAIAITDSNFNASLLGDAKTDWQKQIYQTAVGAIHNVTISQGFDAFNFRANVNHTSQQGVLTGDLYERNAINLSAVKRLFDNSLKLTLTTKGILDDNKFADKGAIGGAVGFDPTHPVYNPDGSYFHHVAQNLAFDNPVFALANDNNRARNKRNITNFNIDYNLPFLEGLKFNLNAGLDYSELSGKQFKGASPKNAGSFNYQNFYQGLNRNTLLDFYFNYKTTLESINTDIDLTAGHSYQEFYIQSNRQETETSGSMVTRPTYIDRNALESYFARASFDFDDKYLISLTFRRDGSSRFGPTNRWSNFPGVSVGWKINNEEFLQNSVFSNLKLRAGWGKTGQQEIGQNYGYLGVYTPGRSDASVQFGYINGVPQYINTLRPEEFDENLKWEETSQYNVALDFGLFNDRLTGTVDAYYRETSDLLATIPTAAGSNLSDLLTTNVGSVLSKGVEFSLNGALAQSQDFNWDMGFNVTLQQNKITKLSLGNDPNFFIAQGGISGGTGNQIQLWKENMDPSTFYVFRQVYDTAGKPIEGAYVDVNGDNQITEADKQAYKKASPDAYLGFTNTINYKNLDFSFTFRGSLGNYMYNNVASDRGNVTTVNDAPGQYYVNAHASVLDTKFNKQNLFSDYYIERADFVKLDNVSIGYLIPGEQLNLRLSLTATNLMTFTKYNGLDPEISNGIDHNFYPRPQTFVLGLNFTF
ncbi:MAG TPA: SusC/RagA family TonB-linked outer membrane protein [Gelidibacter sp.]|uniref:SusC/RagA family TonB-linked outer membrane protein n=1 Tax=Gelidibacter sp. TaxID=2018083 RepID=UPI002BC347D2|nr:SusC/RagA family TonB-linked outer membrane protein [Gelidibacter sp.]HXJ99847.1 SusC/RagA family TonB-linked outer membrane protein [Gelidibacter sp.]